jgi:hypothetical protein
MLVDGGKTAGVDFLEFGVSGQSQSLDKLGILGGHSLENLVSCCGGF